MLDTKQKVFHLMGAGLCRKQVERYAVPKPKLQRAQPLDRLVAVFQDFFGERDDSGSAVKPITCSRLESARVLSLGAFEGLLADPQ